MQIHPLGHSREGEAAHAGLGEHLGGGRQYGLALGGVTGPGLGLDGCGQGDLRTDSARAVTIVCGKVGWKLRPAP